MPLPQPAQVHTRVLYLRDRVVQMLNHKLVEWLATPKRMETICRRVKSSLSQKNAMKDKLRLVLKAMTKMKEP